RLNCERSIAAAPQWSDRPGTMARTLGAMHTDVGRVREHNEDAGYVDPHGRFAILADGMGGHSAGEVASAMAVASVRAALDAAAPTPAGRKHVRAVVERAVRRASDEIRELGQREPDKHGMGTTIEVAIIAATEAFVVHVGDCRTYLVRGGQAAALTVDHTV